MLHIFNVCLDPASSVYTEKQTSAMFIKLDENPSNGKGSGMHRFSAPQCCMSIYTFSI